MFTELTATSAGENWVEGRGDRRASRVPYLLDLASSSSTSPFTLLVAGVVVLSLGTCVGYYEYRDAQRDWHLAERGVESYAWVTRVSPRWSGYGHNRLEDKCELEGLLPEQVQRQPPGQRQSAALVTDASTYFTSVEPDQERSCREYLHTWQRVLFDPGDRKQARFGFGYRSPFEVLFERAALAVLVAALYGGYRVVKRWRRRRGA